MSQRVNIAPDIFQQEIEKLKKENLTLSFQLQQFKALESENEKLREVLNFKNQKKLELAGVEIIAFSPSTWERAVFINSGDKDGLKPGMFAIDEEGNLFGKLVEVKESSSRLAIVSDPNFNLPVFIGDEVFGLLKGNLDGAKILYVENGENLQNGDLVWFKIPPFTAPIKIGTIKSIHKSTSSLFWKIDVKLLLKDKILNKIFIVK